MRRRVLLAAVPALLLSACTDEREKPAADPKPQFVPQEELFPFRDLVQQKSFHFALEAGDLRASGWELTGQGFWWRQEDGTELRVANSDVWVSPPLIGGAGEGLGHWRSETSALRASSTYSPGISAAQLIGLAHPYTSPTRGVYSGSFSWLEISPDPGFTGLILRKLAAANTGEAVLDLTTTADRVDKLTVISGGQIVLAITFTDWGGIEEVTPTGNVTELDADPFPMP